MNVYEQVKQALQDVVAPELKSLQVEIRRLDGRIDSLKTELVSEIKRVDDKIVGMRNTLENRIDNLDDKIDRVDDKIDLAMQIRERLTALEVKLASMEK